MDWTELVGIFFELVDRGMSPKAALDAMGMYLEK